MTWISNLIPYGLATAGIILASAITTKTTGTSPAVSQSTSDRPTSNSDHASCTYGDAPKPSIHRLKQIIEDPY